MEIYDLIEMTRFVKDSERTISRVAWTDSIWFGVERPWLDNKPFVSCIPDGTYPMRRFYDVHDYRSSKRIDTEYVWEICDVMGRTLILFHVANLPRNVAGCVGLGMGVYSDLSGVVSSRVAIRDFYTKTRDYDEMTIVIDTRPILTEPFSLAA